jgi:hypothetical protein
MCSCIKGNIIFLYKKFEIDYIILCIFYIAIKKMENWS